MAKKAAAKINKTALVKEHAKAHPDQKPKEISETLSAKHGAKISAQYVSMILSKDRKSSGTAKKKKGKSNPNNEARGFVEAVAFIKAAGGLDGAKALLANLESLKAVL